MPTNYYEPQGTGPTFADRPSPDRRLAKQREIAIREYDRVTGKRIQERFSAPVPKYHDPSKPRELSTIRDDYIRLAARSTYEQYPQHVGRLALVDYAIVVTNGHFAYAERGPASGENIGKGPILASYDVQSIGYLPAEAWRDYMPVRATVHERTHAITWSIGDLQRVVWTSNDYDGNSSTGWSPLSGIPAGSWTWRLDDRYLWPARGRSWHVSYLLAPKATVPAILLESDARDVAIVVMGMTRPVSHWEILP